MARPVNADAEATRRRILAAALDLFATRGAGDTSIRDIAAAAGVSLAMVHHYFGSKDELYAACIDGMYDELAALRAPLEEALRAGGSLAEIIDRAVRSGFRFARDHQAATRLLQRSIVESGSLDRERQQRVQLPFLAQVSALLAAAIGRTADDLRLDLQSLVAITTRYAISADEELALFTGAPTAEEACARVEDHLVRLASLLLGVAPAIHRASPEDAAPASDRRTRHARRDRRPSRTR